MPNCHHHSGGATMSAVEAKLAELGLTLPPAGTPKGAYVMSVRSGDLLFTAGHIPTRDDGTLITGKVGADLTAEEGAKAAELCALHIMATVKAAVGDLDKVKRIVKLVGFVNCVDGFGGQPTVINGASNLIGKVFGDKGLHARSALGTNSLPLNVAVEIEAIVEVEA
eukprot:TRINITY_DN902_c0_g2_i4.p1 TRINITY_DN902_c0_g2~~TRINITY_DN902_c0_g2_i4.p1  ORF type:complete len:167 (+),score=46.46 TRINITY_DN902_c0_g2_i4:1060-1560(+)